MCYNFSIEHSHECKYDLFMLYNSKELHNMIIKNCFWCYHFDIKHSIQGVHDLFML